LILPDPIIAALIAFCSAVLGGALQARFTSQRERRSFRWAMNRDNYGLYMQGIAGQAFNPAHSPEHVRFTHMQVEAVAKILLQGSPRVVEALVQFRRHDVLASEEAYLDFGCLIEAMRNDVGGKPISGFPALVRSAIFVSKTPASPQSLGESER
jgi:hypothetical protein